MAYGEDRSAMRSDREETLEAEIARLDGLGLAGDPINPFPSGNLLGDDREALFLLQRAGDRAAHTVPLPVQRLGDLGDGRALGAPQHSFQLSKFGLRRCGRLCWLFARLGASAGRLRNGLLLLWHRGLRALHRRPNAGNACTLPSPTFSSQQADHGIAKMAPARYFHGFENTATSPQAGTEFSQPIGRERLYRMESAALRRQRS
jgi:hypothetical protein